MQSAVGPVTYLSSTVAAPPEQLLWLLALSHAALDRRDVEVQDPGSQRCACPQLRRGRQQRWPDAAVLVQKVGLDDLDER